MSKDEIRKKLIDERVNELKKEFEGLNEEQRQLLAYRKIITLSNNKSFRDEIKEGKVSDINGLKSTDELFAIVSASEYNTGLISPLLLYFRNSSNKEYRKVYEESLVSYDRILENYKELARELKFSTALDISHLFTYMLWNGYFSVTKKHSYKLQERLLLPTMYSFDVIKGKGVCLAYAELLHNYLSKCDKLSSLLQCKVPKNSELTRYYKPNIDRKTENSLRSKLVSSSTSFIFNGLIKKYGNHAVTLINDNNKFYIYDPTNLYVLNIVDKDKASIANGNGYFDIKPFQTLAMMPESDPNNLFEKFLDETQEKAFTNKDIRLSFDNVLSIIYSNLSLLNGAYDSIHSDLEVIDKQTDEVGGVFKTLNKIRKN